MKPYAPKLNDALYGNVDNLKITARNYSSIMQMSQGYRIVE